MLSLLLLAIHASQVAAVQCFTPNGDDRNEQAGYANLEVYAPCNSGATHSMCCAWGSVRAAGGSPDVCQSNGFCANGDLLWRESCTDPTWQAPECLKLYVNGTGYGSDPIVYDGNDPITDVLLTECDNGSFCYGNGNRGCCQRGEGLFVNKDGTSTSADPSTTTASSTSSAASSTTTPTSTPTTTPTASSSGLSTGAKAGIGAGVGGCVLAAGVILGLWYARRRKQHKQVARSSMADQKYHPGLSSHQDPTEMQTSGDGKNYLEINRSELDSSSVTRTGRETKSSTTLVEI